MLVAEKLQVQGFHYPFPGIGNVVKDGNGYRRGPGAVESGDLTRLSRDGGCQSGSVSIS